MFRILCILFISFSLQTQTVYKTPSGAKYHLSTCGSVKNVSEKISTTEAKKLNLEPCKLCNPSNIYGIQIPLKNAQEQTKATFQCNGTTKVGTRCRHRTSIGNGYYFSISQNKASGLEPKRA